MNFNFALIKQIDCYFKNCLAKAFIDLTDVDNLSLSAVMRELRKQDEDASIKFLALYKHCFDFLVCNGVEDVETIALDTALQIFSQLYSVKLEKQAAPNAELVGQYLANIIKFTISRISVERRPKSINRLKQKLNQLNEVELANKKLPASSSMGQAITFVKHVLFNHNPQYIREVINNVIKYL